MSIEQNKKWSIKLSLTSNCNLHCFYCNDYTVNPRKTGKDIDHQQIIEILKAAYSNGVKKVQWTGGECTIINLLNYVREAKNIGYLDQSLTSNGLLLADMLPDLILGGLNRVNISLDSLNQNKYRAITGSDNLEQVLKSINIAAKQLNLTKINVAVMRINVDEIGDLVNYSAQQGPNVILKLHELWRFDPESIYHEQHVPLTEIMDTLSKYGTLESYGGITGNNPTIKYYAIKGTNQIVGVSGIPVHFRCGGISCSKLRVYASGRTCDGKQLGGISYNDKVKVIKDLISQRDNSLIDRNMGIVSLLGKKQEYGGK